MDKANKRLHFSDRSSIAGRAATAEIPAFALYGEDDQGGSGEVEPLHIEYIEARSSRYDWAIAPHTHHGLFQILVLCEGSVAARVDEREMALGGGSALAIPPGVVHGFRFEPDSHGFVLTMTEAFLLEAPLGADRAAITELLLAPAVIGFDGEDGETARFQGLLEHLLAEFQGSRAGRPLLVTWLAWSALMQLLRRRPSRAAPDASAMAPTQLLARYRGLIDVHFTEHWPVARYAEALHVTESRLNRLCRALADCSAFQLVQRRILLEAKRRLTYIVIPISRLADELGFDDPAYFCRFFRRHTGQSPSEYRRTALQAIADGGGEDRSPRAAADGDRPAARGGE